MNSKFNMRFQLTVIVVLVSLCFSGQVVFAQSIPDNQPYEDNVEIVIAQIKGGAGDLALVLNGVIQDSLLGEEIPFTNIDASLQFLGYFKAEILINQYDAIMVIWGGPDSGGDNILLYFAFADDSI